MKRSETAFAVASLLVDAIMFFSAGVVSYYIRFTHPEWVGLAPTTTVYPLRTFLSQLALMTICAIVLFAANGLYRLQSTRRFREEIPRIISACSTALLFVIVILFFQREMILSRFLVLAAWGLSVCFVLTGRVALMALQSWAFMVGVGSHRIVLVGKGPVSDRLAQEINHRPLMGYTLVGRVEHWTKQGQQELAGDYLADRFDDVIVAEPTLEPSRLHEIVEWAGEHNIPFKYAMDALGIPAHSISLVTLGSTPLVEPQRTPLEGWRRVGKRLFDIVGAMILIVLTSPIMLAAALLIVADSGFPIFYRFADDGQPIRRVGKSGRLFQYLKFRSMQNGMHTLRYTALKHLDTRADGPLVKIKNDPRVTRVGRFIRRYSIDELPELFLVFVGSMSLVGPRPHLPEEVGRYQRQHKEVLLVKPGMTGLAQVSGRSDLTFEEEVRLDTYYVHHWSLVLDVWILLKTPFVVLRATGV